MTLPNGLAGMLQRERIAHAVLTRALDAIAEAGLWTAPDDGARALAFVLLGWAAKSAEEDAAE